MFNNLTPNPTDSNIASWAWNFGDPVSGQNTSDLKTPQHTYADAGDYNVSLMATTNFSCSAELQLSVTIAQSPVASFNYSPTCEDVSVSFTDSSIGSIQSWDWQIGSSFYSAQNPTHTFTNPVSTNAILTVTGSNNCINSITKPIVVPDKLIPDFSVSKNCIDHQTLFTDITNSSADPVSIYAWDFNGLGTATGSPVNFMFSTTGIKNVTLALTTQTGCEYFITKPVDIVTPPHANFTASPDMGASPLFVQFTNTSSGASFYGWHFDDPENTTSSTVSPSFTFQDVGEYEVSLIAYNTLNCSDTTYYQVVVEAITSAEGDVNFYCKAPYPNPTDGNLLLEWTDYQPGELLITVLNNFGRAVLTSSFSSITGVNEASLNLKELPAGVYFLQMRLGQKKHIFRVVVAGE
jgi:PKD repeat protein